MQKLFTNLVLILALSLVITSCKDNSTDTQSSSNFIFPLAVGNYWIIQSQRFDSNGTVSRTNYNTILIPSDTVINNEKVYFTGSDNEYLGFIERHDGLYINTNDSVLGTRIIWKYPAKKGDVYVPVFGDTTTVISVNTSYTLPLGSFSCYVYEQKSDYGNSIDYTYLYFSPGVGYIAEEHYTQYHGGTKYLSEKHTLFQYHLN